MKATERRYDIDWLRVIAIGLLLIYHIAITFQPWAVFIGFIQSERPLEGMWVPMSMLNIWRIPILFFVSGMGVGFAMRKRNLKELVWERTRRILLPFVFGVIFIVPVHIVIWQKYYNQDLQFMLHPGHLWFLGNIFAYVLILAPLFYVLKKKENSRFVRKMKQVFSYPAGLLIVPAIFALEATLIRPEIYTLYAMTLHGFILGLLAFLFGYFFILTGNPFWNTVRKWRWPALSMALILFVFRWIQFDLRAPNYLLAFESSAWIFGVFGFATRYLNRRGRVLPYLSQAAYPIYIIHMIFLYLGASLIIPLDIPVVAEFILVTLFTGAGSFALYELVLRRVNFLRPFFGLKTEQKTIVKPIKSTAMKTLSLTFFLTSFALMQISCDDYNDAYPYSPPQQIDDGFEVGTLEETGIDTQLLLKGVGKIRQGRFKEVHSMLVYKDDKLVLEEYFPGHQYRWDRPGYHGDVIRWDSETGHQIMSCTKSFTSACIGIAIDLGYIENVHQSIFDYLPDHQHMKYDNREYITIEHLLTMTCGLAWDEWSSSHGTAANDIDRLYLECEDPIVCVLEKPWWSVPGEYFTYNGGGMIILGEILKNATGMNIDEFSMKHLFGPLQVDHTIWTEFPNGMIETAGSLNMSSRDMMKLGVTYLNHGMWKGERIISQDWVDKSSTIYSNNEGINIPIEDSGKNGYGYSWWISEFSEGGSRIKMYRAGGWGGQAIMVFPELDMVVVFTGGNYATKSSLYEIVERFVLPAVL